MIIDPDELSEYQLGYENHNMGPIVIYTTPNSHNFMATDRLNEKNLLSLQCKSRWDILQTK